MLRSTQVHGAVVLRAVALSLVITMVTAAGHAMHDHPPSWSLILATSCLVAIACIPAGLSRLTWRRAIGTMVVGQVVLHAWFAWFSMPAADSGVMTLVQHHGPSTTLLAARDFSGLMLTPGMALAHFAAALLLAALLVRADWLLGVASAVLAGVLRHLPRAYVLIPVSTPAPPDKQPTQTYSQVLLAHDVVRRGPPAYCA